MPKYASRIEFVILEELNDVESSSSLFRMNVQIKSVSWCCLLGVQSAVFWVWISSRVYGVDLSRVILFVIMFVMALIP